MLQQLFCTLSFYWFFSEAAIDKIGQFIASCFEFRWLSICYTLHSLLMLHPQKWWFSLSQFYCYHSQRPDIYFLIIRFFIYELWCHPSRSTNQRLSIQNLFGKLNSKTKICNLYFSLKVQQYVITFKITMKLSSCMKRVQSFKHFSQNISYNFFWYFLEIVVNEIDHCASIHKLYKHEQRFFVIVSEKMGCKVRRITKIHDCYFCSDFFESAIVFHFDDSACIIASVCFKFIISEKYLAHCAFTQLLLEDKFTCRILLNKIYIFDHLLKLVSCQQLQFYMALHQFFLKTL